MASQDQSYEHSLAQAQAGGGVSVRSRASSIVSTRTGVTIATLQDDARSVRSMELIVGRRIFSINRDGSRITEHAGLPPYSFAPPAYSSLDGVAGDASESLPSPNIPNYQEVVSPPEESEYNTASQSDLYVDQTIWPRHESHEREPLTFPSIEQFREDLSLAFAQSTQGTQGAQGAQGERRGSGSVFRTHSFVPGPEKISVVAKRRSVSESNIQTNFLPNNANVNPTHNRLRRRNGVRLPQLDTGASFGNWWSNLNNRADNSPSARMTHSAGPSIGGGINHELQTGDFHYAANYDGSGNGNASRGRSPPTTPRATRSPALAVPQGPPTVEEGYADMEVPPTMDTENEISIHFSRMIRSIDREHRKILHQKCRELADLRERLNEVDQVYRKELKTRDFTIDELRRQVNMMESQMEERVERARNEVEDTWEKRWKEQEKLLLNMQRKKTQADLSRMIGRRWVAGSPLSLAPPRGAAEGDEGEEGETH
ncbi:uncharacterized protein GIQ15_04152 [Arthroderma uncinatum]|uniref:uncharacterized protein n=1 Tax=Arthroderma uncinatum TaxID=74035 RepID=UPI00144AC3BD|nr:uncharacterized protein GIQ15_04152 [Arthroderma uncinatum]KAF3481393.1 hypothetical protein GIQ15_04152 [Arthroderma uncinatum]